MTALKAKDIKKTYPGPESLQILKGISLDIEKGESIAIVGKSGSGKSTLLHILGTLEAPSSGELAICGKDARFFPLGEIRSQHIGFVFQAFHLLEDYSLLENVLMPAYIARKPTSPSSKAYQRALDLLHQVDLLSKVDKPIKLLSGGERQRASIARALCNDPSIILADEPTGNLDSANAEIVQKLLLDCSQKQGKSLILVTHDHEFAALCDRKYQLKEGILEPSV
jgi:lipoprotein-releasing system ATP-binding protein